MQAGRLRHRVTIQNFTTSRTPSGQPVEKWEDGKTIWAEVKGISGRELLAAGAERADATIRVWVLWSSFFGHADQMVGLCTGGQLGGRAGQRFVLCG